MGKITKIVGPVVTATDMKGSKMYDIARVGATKLLGEIIQLNKDDAIIQVYEDTTGVKPNEPVTSMKMPLSIKLGPGLLTSIYDGIARPLPVIAKRAGDFITRGLEADSLNKNKKYEFKAVVKEGQKVAHGDIIGTVQETSLIEHRILVPHGIEGNIVNIKEGKRTVEDEIAVIKTEKGDTSLKMYQEWPVRIPRPYKEKLDPIIPLITGQRIFDMLFPLAKGGTAAIPGPFGAGKCVTGDTLIFANEKLMSIKEVFDSTLNQNKGRIIKDGYETMIELNEPLKVFSFDSSKIKKSVATHLYKGKTKRLVGIKTRSGRSVKLTPIHKLFKVTNDLNIIETEAQYLKEGDYIISPRKIDGKQELQKIQINFDCRVTDGKILNTLPSLIDEYKKENKIRLKDLAEMLDVPLHTLMNFYKSRNKPTLSFVKKLYQLLNKKLVIKQIKTERQSKPINVPPYFSEELAELYSYLISDGMIKGKNDIHFFNKNEKLRKRVSYLIFELFGIKTKKYYARTVEAVMVSNASLARILVSLGFPLNKKSNLGTIPKGLIKSPDSIIKKFIKAYISCDGHIGKREIEITTASKKMASGLSYLLLRLGILYRNSVRIINNKNYYRLFISPREAIKLSDYYCKEYYFNSTDIVPMTSTLFKRILGNNKPFQLEKQGIPTASYYVNQNQTTKTFQKVIQKIDTEQHFKLFADALDYVFCDRIKSIRFIDQETDVYDITVPETHNFVGGDYPMILHNTVAQQTLAKWVDADVIVYIGCGERGNEMTEVLDEFPHLLDPKSGKPLMERTVLIANTSNMPVAAREASVYTGVTIAEYFRDQGYNVALMADSTSRWAEAMREISSRLEEMPGEEGYPAYLASRLAQFYERSGRVTTLNNKNGSVSIIGAVSPPGGDFSEPVTQNTLRITKVFWALDAPLAYSRHFPAINWLTSYSLYTEKLSPYFDKEVASDFSKLRVEAMTLLQKEAELKEIVQLVGPDALPEEDKLILDTAKSLREDFLQQNAYHEIDTYCNLKKQYLMLKTIIGLHKTSSDTVKKGVKVSTIITLPVKEKIARMKYVKEIDKEIKAIEKDINEQLGGLVK